MRAPLSWLRDFAPDLPRDVGAVVDACNHLGLVVDGVEEPGRGLDGVVVAEILAVLPHPNADRLRLADVDPGSGRTRVVCGAPNIEAGQRVPFAPVGVTLPDGRTLQRAKIRGEVSDGMLCSAVELGLGEDAGGILILADDSPVGAELRTLLGLDEVVLDLDITPNRPDAMSIMGIARDLAAHFRVPFVVSQPQPAASGPAVGDGATVRIEAPERCPRYVAWTARVRVGPSPEWLARRLVHAGLRPINNVVDVTNYVMLERGQPLHAFDHDRLPGRGIVVRAAGTGEVVTTLDGVERRLDVEDLLICDAHSEPQAIAGVMGAARSEVSDETTAVLLESAYFEPTGISRTSKRLGLRTDASARFERGVDPAATFAAAARAMELMEAVAEAVVGGDPIDEHPRPVTPRRIALRTSRVNDLLGTELSTEAIAAYLEPLGIAIEGREPGAGRAPGEPGRGEVLHTVIPTVRPDLEREIDLVEEVARHHGYNAIRRDTPSSGARAGRLTARQRDRRLVRDALVGAGLDETYSSPLVAPADLERAGLDASGSVELENPLRGEESLLRTTVLPGLLRAAEYNASHGLADVALFEVGHVFGSPSPATEPLPTEVDHLAGLLVGTVRRRPHEADRPVDVYDATGVLGAVLSALDIADHELVAGPAPVLHPARAAAVVVSGRTIGSVGEIDPDVRERYGLGAAVGFELDLDALLDAPRRERQHRTPSVFPASSIDLAFVVGRRVPASAVEGALRAAVGELLEHVELFDVFEGEALGAGQRSLAFRLRLRAADRTLTDAEVGTIRQQAIEAVAGAVGGRLRG
jgi:phenylalanyl-tRNA synthetase beta chain